MNSELLRAALYQFAIYAILINMPRAKTVEKPKTAPSKKTVKTLAKKAQKKAVSKPKENVVPSTIKCSFCGKSTDTARRMIAGPPPDNAFICDECLFVCVKILFEENPKEAYKDLLWLISSLGHKIEKSSKKVAVKPNAKTKNKGKN